MAGFSSLALCTPSSFAVAAVSVHCLPVLLGSVGEMRCSVGCLVVEVSVVSRGLVLVCSSVVKDVVVEEVFVNGKIVVFSFVITVLASEVGLPLVAGVVCFVVVSSGGDLVVVVVVVVLLLLMLEVVVDALLPLVVPLIVVPVDGIVVGLTVVEMTDGVVFCVSFVVLLRLVGAVKYIHIK